MIASCGLIYELVAGTLASYLLGDSVFQFSTVIGTYLFAMGIGSYLSRFVKSALVDRFVSIELMVGLAGGFSSAILFLAFAETTAFRFVLYAVVLVVGTLVGLEIPLLMRILENKLRFSELVAHVLTFDYLGALAASLAFPLVLVPHLGMVRSALLFGIVNAGVALWSTFLFRAELVRPLLLRGMAVSVLLALAGGVAASEWITSVADTNLYADQVIFSKDTRYQRIVMTRWKDDLRLFLSSHLQFSSRDEYRYHEALVHPGLAGVPGAKNVLVLGGGDGLAVREILKYPEVERVTLVDLDPEMTKLFSTNALLTKLNGGSLLNSRVHVINADAFVWLDQNAGFYDFVVVDFPDPTNYSLGKLYTTAFYRLLAKHLSANGHMVVQSTSPLFARQSFWCIEATLRKAGLQTNPYHLYVPSFGEWGFVLAGMTQWHEPARLPDGLRFLSASAMHVMFEFPHDMQPVPAEVNRLNDQVLVRYYEKEWSDIAH